MSYQGPGERAHPNKMAAEFVKSGALGKKNNKGFYLYDEKGKVTGKNDQAETFLPSTKKTMDETQLQMRLFLPMINEAAYCLMDKIVVKAAPVDLAMVYGTGFPPFKGGLLRYADSEGLDRLLAVLQQFSSEVSGDRYTPAPLLQELAQAKRHFYDL